MPGSYDAVVVGLGAMGSAVACHLAGRGARVLGLDRFTPPHDRGSSHGESRIIRQAYYEHPVYVPLVRRAFRLWEELEARSGRTLLRRTGIVNLGPPDGELVSGVLRSVREHGLPHERLEGEALRRRFPLFRPEEGWVGVYEEEAGILFPEECVRAHLEGAREGGAELRYGEPVRGWRADDSGVEVETERGRYAAGALVLCAGAWLPGLAPALPLVVERQTTHWFRPRQAPEAFALGRFPAFLYETGAGEYYYGIPDLGAGFKAARHHGGWTGPLEALDDRVGEGDVAEVRRFLARHLPAAEGEPLRSTVCRYTNTPACHFLVDRHPERPRTWVVSPCSGHGFKFASVIGEVVAGRVRGEESGYDLSLFSLGSTPL